jgi:hypothetical protein
MKSSRAPRTLQPITGGWQRSWWRTCPAASPPAIATDGERRLGTAHTPTGLVAQLPQCPWCRCHIKPTKASGPAASPFRSPTRSCSAEGPPKPRTDGRSASGGVCGVQSRVRDRLRHHVPLAVGANPTRRPLQPEATGAAMEVTKWLKPSVSVSRYTVTARVCRP